MVIFCIRIIEFILKKFQFIDIHLVTTKDKEIIPLQNSDMNIAFYQQNTNPKLSNRKALKLFIQYLFKKEKKNVSKLDYIFCNDDVLLNINQQYLNHNYFTDIITFDLSNDLTNIIGEVYISVDRIKENAQQFKTTYQQELHRVIFHGALHLCNYKDKSPKDKTLMRKKEDFYLNQYSLL